MSQGPVQDSKYATTSLAIFDDFMSFLRHLNFRAEDLVIKNINELPDYISKQRPIVAERRTCVSRTAGPPATRSSNNSTVSTLVVGSLAECIASERTPSKFVVAEKLNFRRCRTDTTLKIMALVHRFWTAIAQRTFYRRISVSGVRNMRALLQSTLLGPWVRELSIKGILHAHELQCRCFDNEDQGTVWMRSSILER